MAHFGQMNQVCPGPREVCPSRIFNRIPYPDVKIIPNPGSAVQMWQNGERAGGGLFDVIPDPANIQGVILAKGLV
jgi:hypothetical protein